jgi:hypothetical protein
MGEKSRKDNIRPGPWERSKSDGTQKEFGLIGLRFQLKFNYI